MLLNEIGKIRPLFSKSDKSQYCLLLGLMFVGSFLDVLGIGAIPVFIATLAAPDQLQAVPILGNLIKYFNITPGQDLVVWGAACLMALFILRNLFIYFVKYFQVRLTEHHRVRLTDQLFQAYIEAPWEIHLTRDSATIMRNVTMETVEIMTGIVNPLLNLAMHSMMTILIVILLVLTTPLAAVAGVFMIGTTVAAFLMLTRKRVERYGEQARAGRKNIIKSVNQALALLPELKVLGKERFFQELTHRIVSEFAKVTRLRQAINLAAPPVLEVVAVIGILSIVVVLVSLGKDPASLLPMLALYAAAVVRLRQYIGTFATDMNQLQFSKAAIPNVVAELEELGQYAEPSDRGRVTKKLTYEKSIELVDVTYTYPGTKIPALENLNLDIKKGESIGFVGSTGSGKSTFINVVLGLLRQQKGSITVDNVDVRQNMAGWLQHIGYIPQTIVLLDDTIRRNIAFGLIEEEISEDQVQAAVEAAQLANLVQELPEGLDTVVGERGIRLSGGQRQRVGIARALYTNPDVILMDEATAALDNQTEELLMSGLNRFKEDRTFIMIAHRLTTVRNCDRLYFMDQGKISAVGTYAELLETHSKFREMALVS